ncbi:hypothetical protein F4779DRAFT_450959 [Xylariaceae sp. FL0662B]|nr:hypothetical protein F4779DRAFT_450959 [Xylariaceae sp. FL0662B]
MKVIITGATGFVGGALVRQAIADDRITHAFVLTRRPLSEEVSKSEKLTVIQHQDFSTYPPDLLKQLAGAEACLWAIGGRAYQFPDLETAKKVQVDFTLAAANAFLDALAPQLPEPQKFRFVFCSGKFAEWDQEKRLLMLPGTRRLKGLTEKGLCELADANKSKLEIWAVRPGGIVKSGARPLNILTAYTTGCIDVDHLAKDMIRIAHDGHQDRIIESDALLKM